uniref:EF-hand domain-containing protein n=1 Tax=Macrostomum lignano TaxID=282301 RepID=A0A1I8JJH2_9PLAT
RPQLENLPVAQPQLGVRGLRCAAHHQPRLGAAVQLRPDFVRLLIERRLAKIHYSDSAFHLSAAHRRLLNGILSILSCPCCVRVHHRVGGDKGSFSCSSPPLIGPSGMPRIGLSDAKSHVPGAELPADFQSMTACQPSAASGAAKLVLLVAAVALLLTATCSASSAGHHQHGSHGIHDDRVMTNAESHLSEDFGIKKDPSEMSRSEIEFYEFKSHDFDKNGKLDGLEMLKAMTHYDYIDVNHLTPEEERTLTPKQIAEKKEKLVNEKHASMEREIDHVMDEHDLDKDGYVDYSEYLTARWKDGN